MERTGLAALIEILEGSGVIVRLYFNSGRITEECLSVYNVDGSMQKNVKSNLLDLFNLDPIGENPNEYISLVDMGFIWHLATPSSKDCESKKRDGSKYQWSDYLEKISAITLSRHLKTSQIVLVNDIYDLINSIKDDEHDRCAEKKP